MRIVTGVVVLFSWAGVGAAAADDAAALPFVSPIFGDNMVLQRGKPNTLWGWSRPGDTVRVEIAGRRAQTVTRADGRWQMQIQPPAPGGPYAVKIDGGAQHVVLREVLVGDVWLAGGQSNMQFGLSGARDATDEIKASDHPEIRLFTVTPHVAYAEAAVPKGTWRICSPETAASFSAVAYFFGRRLQEDVPVPIGLIADALGGSPIESWMSPEALGGFQELEAPLAEIARLKAQGGSQYGSFLMHWLDQYDVGLKNKTWAAPDLDDSGWKEVTVPGGFAELGMAEVPSVCWFRKEVTLPDPLPSGKATLLLGVVDKMDTAYVNGQWVGASSWVENPRAYPVREGLLKPGRNVIAVRVFKLKQGGFLSKPEDLRLAFSEGTQVPLAGEWKGHVSVDARPPHPLPLDVENYPTMPTVLYRGMIAPLEPLALTGAIWYQGEANFTRAFQYRRLLPALIADWRRAFGQGELPFYIVGLPAFMARSEVPRTDGWAELREAQALTVREVRHTGLAVTVDTGDADNIHPKDKKVVGERLALCALAQHYREPIAWEGPTFKSVERLPGALRLRFDHVDGGLVVKGDKLGEFSVAGTDRKWHWAEAKIEGHSIVVSSPAVPEPVAARYAWQANPLATLFSAAGLPAVPFRTDDWPLSTEARQP